MMCWSLLVHTDFVNYVPEYTNDMLDLLNLIMSGMKIERKEVFIIVDSDSFQMLYWGVWPKDYLNSP